MSEGKRTLRLLNGTHKDLFVGELVMVRIRPKLQLLACSINSKAWGPDWLIVAAAEPVEAEEEGEFIAQGTT